MDLEKHFEAARKSKSRLGLLNRILWAGIPFNKPHRLQIVEMTEERVVVKIPYRRKNLNHLKGLHACVLATGAEYASGLVLLQQLNAKNFRLIMQSMEVTYHYQGKMESFVKYELSKERVNTEIQQILESEDKVAFTCHVEVHDKEGNHLCTSKVHWQIKKWSAVTAHTA